MTKQSGFTALEMIFGLTLIAVMSVAGLFAITNYRTSRSAVSNTTTHPPAVTPDPSKYLVIKEWNAKIKLRDAAKISYSYAKADLAITDAKNERPDSFISIEVKSQYLQDPSCKVSVGWSRYPKLESNFFLKSATKIGAFYFLSGGSPYNCANKADNTLNARIRSDVIQLEAL